MIDVCLTMQITAQANSLGGWTAQKTLTSLLELVHVFVYCQEKGGGMEDMLQYQKPQLID